MTDSTFSPSREWPTWPNLDQFQQQAKDLLNAYRAGEADAIAEVQRHERTPDPAAFALHDALCVVARSYGFASWPKMKTYVEMIDNYRQPDEPKSQDKVNLFLRLACITYFDGDHPARRQKARNLLAKEPHLAKANIYTAAAVGDFAAVADFLAQGSDVHAKGGPFDWEPLLYAAYSRLDSEAECHSTFEVGRVLLENGADPNAGFLWDWGSPYPCLLTALTGVLGLGEADTGRGEGPLIQPPHQHWYEFARLLLEAGADPNDNQGLYNRMQYPDNEHLKLLLEYGLGKGPGGLWFKRFFQVWPCVDRAAAAGYLPYTPADMVAYQLRWAVGANALDRVKLLVENGVDVNGSHGGVTPYTAAVSKGHQEIAEYLVEHGARRIAVSLSPAKEFAIACNRANADRARELVASHPSLRDTLGDLLTEAAEKGRVETIRLLVELGVDLNGKPGDTTALHCAARAGQLETVQLLVELGADVHARARNFNGTPLRFANYKGQRTVVEYLLSFATICEAVEVGGLDRVRALLRENPERVRVRDKDGRTPLHYPYRDTQNGAQIIELLLAHGADASARDNEGRTPADQMLQRGRRDLAEVMRRHGGHSA